jgi:gas vesicle protein
MEKKNVMQNEAETWKRNKGKISYVWSEMKDRNEESEKRLQNQLLFILKGQYHKIFSVKRFY